MPVSNAAADQSNPIVLQSFPDSGYFVIWQGSRNYATSKTDIYAQKYDKNGIRQWVQNGVPVTTALEDQSYAFLPTKTIVTALLQLPIVPVVFTYAMLILQRILKQLLLLVRLIPS